FLPEASVNRMLVEGPSPSTHIRSRFPLHPSLSAMDGASIEGKGDKCFKTTSPQISCAKSGKSSPGSQVSLKPIGGQPRRLLQFSRLLEQVCRAGHNLQFLHAQKLSKRFFVQSNDRAIQSADDEQRRRNHSRQGLAGHVGTPAA